MDHVQFNLVRGFDIAMLNAICSSIRPQRALLFLRRQLLIRPPIDCESASRVLS